MVPVAPASTAYARSCALYDVLAFQPVIPVPDTPLGSRGVNEGRDERILRRDRRRKIVYTSNPIYISLLLIYQAPRDAFPQRASSSLLSLSESCGIGNWPRRALLDSASKDSWTFRFVSELEVRLRNRETRASGNDRRKRRGRDEAKLNQIN